MDHHHQRQPPVATTATATINTPKATFTIGITITVQTKDPPLATAELTNTPVPALTWAERSVSPGSQAQRMTVSSPMSTIGPPTPNPQQPTIPRPQPQPQPSQLQEPQHIRKRSRMYKPRVLHIGSLDPSLFDPELRVQFESQADIIFPPFSIQPPTFPMRPAFIQDLRDRTWGDFDAVLQTCRHSSVPYGIDPLGVWDDELINLLPTSVKVFSTASSARGSVNPIALGQRGILYSVAHPTCSDQDAARFSIQNVMAVLAGERPMPPVPIEYPQT